MTKPIDQSLEQQILNQINKVNYYNNGFKSIYSLLPGIDCLIFALRYYKERKLSLTTQEWDCLIQNSNLHNTDGDDMDALMWAAVANNPRQNNINLSQDQFSYLIKNSDLKRTHKNWNSLMYILKYHSKYITKLDDSSFNYLIENSNLLQKDRHLSTSVLGLVLEEKLALIDKVFSKIISNPEFNIKNYRKDNHYKEIKNKIIEIDIKNTKNNIEKSILIDSHNKKDFKL